MIIVRSNRTPKSLAAICGLAIAALVTSGAPLLADAVPGKPAPEFSATDSNGKAVKLSDYKGRTVVLEWTNDGCPYVRKHYGSGNMQALQKDAAAKDIVWLTVISSAKGEQGYADGAGANKLTADRKAAPAAILLDPAGSIGRAYGGLDCHSPDRGAIRLVELQAARIGYGEENLTVQRTQ